MIAFAIAFIVHVFVHGGGSKVVLDAELIGFVFLAAHFAFGERVTGWVRPVRSR